MVVAYVTLLALTAGVLLGTVWWRHRRAPAPREIEWEDVLVEAAKGGYKLITTAEVASRYQKDTQSLLLVDTRPEGEYRTGHIRGAVNLPLTPTWWGRWRSRKLLAALLGSDRARMVVFY